MRLIGNVQLVAGDADACGEIFRLLQREGIEARGNPDVYVREYPSFGVEEARELAQRASSRAVSSSGRVFIIIAPGMTSEAQNALLKTLEEPSGNALFFIVVPSPQTLLPTLRSRAQFLSLEFDEQKAEVDVKLFLKAGTQKRLDMLKPLHERNEDEERDIAGSIAFLWALEKELSHDPEKNSKSLEALYRARRYIGDKGSLMKTLLEQVALLV